MKINKEIVMIIIFAWVAITLGTIIFMKNYRNNDEYKIKKHLEQGNQCINDLDYEDAITEFVVVISIDDTNVEAYMKIAEAYHNLEDFEKEKKTL